MIVLLFNSYANLKLGYNIESTRLSNNIIPTKQGGSKDSLQNRRIRGLSVGQMKQSNYM